MLLRFFSFFTPAALLTHLGFLVGWVRPEKRFWRVAASLLLMLCLVTCPITNAQALSYNKEDLIDADFSGKDLTDSSFTKALLRRTNFSGANLSGVSFFGANLEDANLEGANLSYATLDSARLVDANLTNAVLEGAFAFNAKFNRATITGADFTDVLMRTDQQEILCAIADGINPTTGRATRDSLDCY
ncbi:MAG: pentapeptide repeat-containing protein [Cyanobacteria bacterium J06638_20]